MSTRASSRLLRHAPPDWRPGLTRVEHIPDGSFLDGRLGTFMRNSEPLPGVTPRGWLGVLIRFDGRDELVDVDPEHLKMVCLRDPFAAVRAALPTRYAPGATGRPYDYPSVDPATWHPVIYYAAGTVIPAEGDIWLVEPYPAERADGSDGCDPVTAAGVTVVRGVSAPRPRHMTYQTYRRLGLAERRACDGDWIIPGRYTSAMCAYDVHVDNPADLLAAWCEAWAVAAALNGKEARRWRVAEDDVQVLLAAERRALRADSRRTAGWFEVIGEPGETVTVSRYQLESLLRGTSPLIEPALVNDHGRWQETLYAVAPAGAEVLRAVRRAGADLGGPRCRVCGCTEQRACPDGCSWLSKQPGRYLCTACPPRTRR